MEQQLPLGGTRSRKIYLKQYDVALVDSLQSRILNESSITQPLIPSLTFG